VVLESRHLVGLFVLMVVIFGVVFVLGYEMGRNQGVTQARATEPSPDVDAPGMPGVKPTAQPTSQPPVKPPANSGSASSAPPPATKPPANAATKPPVATKTSPPATNKAQPAAKPPAASNTRPQPAPSSGKPPSNSTNAPLIPRGAILLQVAALTKESDALEMAGALQKKRFPAFVVPPSGDHFYRVQVGPYADVKSAEAVRKALENEGFKSIVKR
jgi:cell division septation protein DedD